MESSPLQAYDIVMLVVLVGTTIFGAWKGMAWQLASLASVVVSTIVALHFSSPLAPYLSSQEPWNHFLAMLILYVVTSLAIWLLFRLVAGAIDRVKLREFDHQIGGLFGLAKGILLCLVITFFAVTLSEQTRQAILKSYSGRAIAFLLKQGTPMMPEEVRAVVGKYVDELDRKLDPNTPPDPETAFPLGLPDLPFGPAPSTTEKKPAEPFGTPEPAAKKPATEPNRGQSQPFEFPREFPASDRT